MDNWRRERQRLPWAGHWLGQFHQDQSTTSLVYHHHSLIEQQEWIVPAALSTGVGLTAVGLNLVPVNQSAPRQSRQSRQFAGAVNLVDVMVVALLERRAWPADCSRAGWQTLSV